MNSLERYLGDTYELVDTLKSSAQGFVVVVYDKRAKRLCMMKQRTLNSLPIYQTLKELNNPHVPQIYRLFERDGKLIVIEEHIDGQTLEELLIYRQVDETLSEKILLQLCDALNVLHDKNIIHRDLKPSNIMLTEKNSVKLIDFGIARFFKPESKADTELMGTRGYAPPEQFGLFDFGQTDRRSDIYALGITIRNLLGTDYDGRLKKILDKCTALEPTQRYQSAEELSIAVLRGKKFYFARRVFVAALIGLALFFLPSIRELKEKIPTPVEEPKLEEKISAPVEEPKLEEKIPTPVEEPKLEEKISAPVEEPKLEEKIPAPVEEPKPKKETFALPTLPQVSLPEINLPTTPTPLPEINRPPAQVETSGEVEMKLFLNGELTGKEHMVYLSGWQSWSRDNYGQILFPDDWHARLYVENHSGKDLINPRLEVNIGDYEEILDVPTIKNGQSFALEIPLGSKLASPEKGSGHLQIILSSTGVPDIFLNKTFFLVK